MKKKHKLNNNNPKNKGPNIKVIIYSILAFCFLVLTFILDWSFIAGSALMVWLNQRELMKK